MIRRLLCIFLVSMFPSLATAQDEGRALRCGAPYAVIELMHHVLTATEVNDPVSGVAQTKLGSALDSLDRQGSVGAVTQQLGEDAGEALISLMILARNLVRGELPPDFEEVSALTNTIKSAAKAPCIGTDQPVVSSKEPSDKYEDPMTENQVTKTEKVNVTSETVVSDKPIEPDNTAPTAETTQIAGATAPTRSWFWRYGWSLSLFVMICGAIGARLVIFRFERRACQIPMTLGIADIPHLGFARQVSRTSIHFHTDLSATLDAFNGVEVALPHAVSMNIGNQDLFGKITKISDNTAVVALDAPLTFVQFESLLDESLDRLRKTFKKYPMPDAAEA